MFERLAKAPTSAVLLAGMTIASMSWQAQAEMRGFTIAAVELKGGAAVDKEPFPTEALPAGASYVLTKPNEAGRWEVSVYLWTPSQITVNQDDEVTLEFVGINGASHPTTIAGYNKSFGLKRGSVTRVNFKAEGGGVSHPVRHAQTVDG